MANIFQSHEWEQFKLQSGYQKSYRVDGVLVLQKNLPLGRTMLYAPMVSQPTADEIMNSESRIKDFMAEIRKIGNEQNSIFFRLEFDVPVDHDSYPIIHDSAIVQSFEEMQPENTWVLDLSQSEEEIQKNMKPRARYNIRLAEKSGVTVKSGFTAEHLDIFYNLHSSTAIRHGISYRSKDYFARLVECLRPAGLVKIFVAYLDEEPISSHIIISSGDTAINMFGASSTDHREVKAPHLLQWRIIEECKSNGFAKYDFFGIAPSDDSKHKWAGITSFKKSFGGYQRDLMGSYDLIFKPLEYQIFKLAENIRRPK
ncbi:MAG: peptidoglycan bridge formation glycyltransferase FemA/FemB family protein [Candidatus Berkelbacteria bacterium]